MQIPQRDGPNVGPFLFFEVSIHLALLPSFVYRHLHVQG